MITGRVKKGISTGLAGLMIYTFAGCATFRNLKDEVKYLSSALNDPVHEVLRNDENLNLEPPAMNEASQKLHNDESRHATSHPYTIANNRAYLQGETPEAKNNGAFFIPEINANYIDLDGNNDGKGDVLISYRCRNAAPDIAAILAKYLPPAPDVEITPYPSQNMLLFRGQDVKFGENFGLISRLINNFDIEPKQIRIRLKIVEYFNDNTYDRDMALKILKNGMSAFSLLLPSNPQGNPLTTGISVNPFLNKDGNGNFTILGRAPNKWTYEGAIKFLDSHGRTETLSDTDVVVSNGTTAEFRNINAVPYQQTSLTPAAAIVIGTQYREVGPQLKLSPFANEKGFTTIKLLEAKSGESIALVGKEQVPVFREANLTSEFCLQNGATYLIGTSTNTRYKSVNRGIPGLNKIPLIKSATTSREIEKNTSELLYFMEVHDIDRQDSVGMQERIQEPLIEELNIQPVKQEKSENKGFFKRLKRQ